MTQSSTWYHIVACKACYLWVTLANQEIIKVNFFLSKMLRSLLKHLCLMMLRRLVETNMPSMCLLVRLLSSRLCNSKNNHHLLMQTRP